MHLYKRIAGNYLRDFKNFKFSFKTYAELEKKAIMEVAPGFKEGRQKDLIDALNAKFALLCLSKTEQNLPMWAHYADQYRGFVIQFDGTHEFFNPKDGNHIVREVKYKEERPWVGLDDAINDEAQEILYTKSPDWGYEKELRLVRQIRHGVRVEAAPGKPAYAFALPPECITSVLLGCRASTTLRDDIQKSLSQPDYKHVSLMQTNIHRDKFSLDTQNLK